MTGDKDTGKPRKTPKREPRDRSKDMQVAEVSTSSANSTKTTMEPVYLPDEILVHILEYVSHQASSQRTLATCCLLSRQWYNTAVSMLYHHPTLSSKYFAAFVSTICPSKNVHVKRSPRASLVKILDLSLVVHPPQSHTARLLGRTKGNLEAFIAPQSSFSLYCFPALSKCQHLDLLDLSLVSESPPLPELFKTMSNLTSLRTLRLPRSSGFGVHHKSSSFGWPINLEHLSLSGGIDAHFLHGIVAFPTTLRSLTIDHCPNAKGFAVTHLLKTAVRPLANLENLKIANMPRLSSHALDDVLFLLPQLSKLSVSVDYITPAIFDEGHFHHIRDPLPTLAEDEMLPNEPLQHNLRTLELTNSGSMSGVEDKITPIDVMIAIDEGCLPKLRQVRVAESLLWQSSSTREDVHALTDALQEGSKRDWEGREWVFADMDEREYLKEKWKGLAGVWVFEG